MNLQSAAVLAQLAAAGARLHTRIVALFSLVAMVPAVIMAVFSALFFQFGLQTWFSERVNTAVRGSVAVAESYVQEHAKTITTDALAIAADMLLRLPIYAATGRWARLQSTLLVLALVAMNAPEWRREKPPG